MTRQTVLALLFLLFLFAWVYSMEKEPHAFQQSECANCHVTGVTGQPAKQSGGALSMSCKRCHAKTFSEGYMHPYNVRPRNVSVPADMPLSPSGELTCNTCHNVHASYLTPFGKKSYYLRRYETGKKFCETCHRAGISKSSHNAMLGEAHFTSKYIVTDPSQNIDPMSKNCVSCHDGSFSTSAMVRVGTWTHGTDFIKFDKGAHPIGIDYESTRLKMVKSDLKPIGAVDRRIRFYKGKIGCGSCHDPYSTLEKNLVMSDRGSMLCFSCHAMGR